MSFQLLETIFCFSLEDLNVCHYWRHVSDMFFQGLERWRGAMVTDVSFCETAQDPVTPAIGLGQSDHFFSWLLFPFPDLIFKYGRISKINQQQYQLNPQAKMKY